MSDRTKRVSLPPSLQPRDLPTDEETLLSVSLEQILTTMGTNKKDNDRLLQMAEEINMCDRENRNPTVSPELGDVEICDKVRLHP